MIDDLGLLVSRLVLGLSYASHGAQKAFGWFEGPGPQVAAGLMESLGFKPSDKYAQAAYYSELAAGTTIALGFGGPIGPAMVLGAMLVAQETVNRKNGYYASKGGIELGVIYSAGALALASAGYGEASLDRALGIDKTLRHPGIVALALAGGIAAGYYVLQQRDTSPPPGTLATPTIKGEHNGTVGTDPAAARN
jgi:putative oxidoreductase